MKKRGQISGMDMVIALIIFSIGIITFYVYVINSETDTIETIEALSYDGKLIAESLLSEGVPENWTTGNVDKIGILSDGKINETKLEDFYNITSNNYALTRLLFNTRYDYYFFLSENITFNGTIVDGIGKAGVTRDSVVSDNLVKIARVTIYRDKLVNAYIYVWN